MVPAIREPRCHRRERQPVPGRDDSFGHFGDPQARYPDQLSGQVARDVRPACEVAVQASELVVGDGGGEGVDAELEAGA
ncbi:hypothetical protein HS99_0031225 [Kitasatospora aureofaciens]|uniref:Uncharacterized protein n=1 Tax=Kitasatospora aureofaciens TaxID=1894 RepID=A0A1E7N624_KITAU|nr:hypothetical protein B6264_15205 [Kitasatospora aureofaciens]OEV36140.1 hypothetical protein HS99_0031225 [Kitasatospora aureofaciens]GGV02607.1 hypothetical protein GCM10010502_66550 [Kitasatospora aureofaciens]